MRWLLPAILALSTAATPPPLSDPSTSSETLALARDYSSRMTLLAQVNGHGPYPFTIDTAAEHSVVSDQLAAELGLASAEPATLYSVLGASPVSTVAIDTLRIGKREHRVGQAPVLPIAALGAKGLIGLDALADENLLFDFQNHRVTIARSAGDAMLNDPQTIRVSARRRFGDLILTDASVNGVKVWAILDTGAENTLGNLALRRMVGSPGPLKSTGAEVIGVTGGTMPVEVSALPRIRLGPLSLMNMPIAYGDIATFRKYGLDRQPAILLGMDVLRAFERVAVDFRRREVRFRISEDPQFRTS